MKEAIFETLATLDSYIGSGRIILLFLCVAGFVFYINTYEKNYEGRRISPAVFLLSIWSGIAYAFTKALRLAISDNTEEKNKDGILNCKAFKIIFIVLGEIIAIYVSGRFVFSETYMKESVYYYTHYLITIIAIISIISFFVFYFLISLELFENIADRLIFMGFVIMLHLFAGYTVDALKYSVFLNPLSVGSIILHDFMPFALLITLIRINQEKPKEEAEEIINDDDYEEEWDLKKHKILNMRNTAVAIALLAVLFIASVFVLNSKINSLYDVTVALEKATEDKISYYEFKNKGSDEVIATLMITGEGTAIVTGGGGEENGNDLLKFITDHTTKVDKWYIYSKDEKDRGAIDYCYNKGLIVSDLYLITGIEKADEVN